MTISDILSTSLGSFTIGEACSALVTLLICVLIIRAVMKILGRLFSRTHLDGKAQKYVLTAIKAVLYVITALIVLGSLNIDMTSLVALLSVCSLGVTLAMEDILGNMAGGLVILSTHPFQIGDYVEADGVGGTIEEISLNHTKLLTADGQYILVPNRALSSSKITNYSRLGRRRIAIKVTASYDASTADVMAACADAMAQTPNLLADPAPVTRLTNYGESAIEYTLYCWTAVGDYWDSYFALMQNIRGAFDKHNVEMTYEHLNVHIVEK